MTDEFLEQRIAEVETRFPELSGIIVQQSYSSLDGEMRHTVRPADVRLLECGKYSLIVVHWDTTNRIAKIKGKKTHVHHIQAWYKNTEDRDTEDKLKDLVYLGCLSPTGEITTSENNSLSVYPMASIIVEEKKDSRVKDHFARIGVKCVERCGDGCSISVSYVPFKLD